MPRATHTIAELELTQFAYDEVAGKLHEAGYEHAFGIGTCTDRGLIDMHGIGITRAADPKLSRLSYVTCEKKGRDNYTVTASFFTLQSAQAFHQWVANGSAKQSEISDKLIRGLMIMARAMREEGLEGNAQLCVDAAHALSVRGETQS